MSAAAPKRKIDAITEELNSFVQGAEFSLDRLQHFEDEAKRLENFGFYTDAKMISGMVAAVKGDVKEVRSSYKAALLNSGNDPYVIENYATSLVNASHPVEALDLVDQLLVDQPYSVDLLGLGILGSHNSYDRARMESYVQRMSEILPEKKNEIYEYLTLFDDQFKSVFDGLSADVLRSFSDKITEVHDVLVENGHYIRVISDVNLDDQIMVVFYIIGDESEAAAAESDLHEYMANCPYSEFDQYIVTGCMPL